MNVFGPIALLVFAIAGSDCSATAQTETTAHGSAARKLREITAFFSEANQVQPVTSYWSVTETVTDTVTTFLCPSDEPAPPAQFLSHSSQSNYVPSDIGSSLENVRGSQITQTLTNDHARDRPILSAEEEGTVSKDRHLNDSPHHSAVLVPTSPDQSHLKFEPLVESSSPHLKSEEYKGATTTVQTVSRPQNVVTSFPVASRAHSDKPIESPRVATTGGLDLSTKETVSALVYRSTSENSTGRVSIGTPTRSSERGAPTQEPDSTSTSQIKVVEKSSFSRQRTEIDSLTSAFLTVGRSLTQVDPPITAQISPTESGNPSAREEPSASVGRRTSENNSGSASARTSYGSSDKSAFTESSRGTATTNADDKLSSLLQSIENGPLTFTSSNLGRSFSKGDRAREGYVFAIDMANPSTRAEASASVGHRTPLSNTALSASSVVTLKKSEKRTCIEKPESTTTSLMDVIVEPNYFCQNIESVLGTSIYSGIETDVAVSGPSRSDGGSLPVSKDARPYITSTRHSDVLVTITTDTSIIVPLPTGLSSADHKRSSMSYLTNIRSSSSSSLQRNPSLLRTTSQSPSGVKTSTIDPGMGTGSTTVTSHSGLITQSYQSDLTTTFDRTLLLSSTLMSQDSTITRKVGPSESADTDVQSASSDHPISPVPTTKEPAPSSQRTLSTISNIAPKETGKDGSRTGISITAATAKTTADHSESVTMSGKDRPERDATADFSSITASSDSLSLSIIKTSSPRAVSSTVKTESSVSALVSTVSTSDVRSATSICNSRSLTSSVVVPTVKPDIVPADFSHGPLDRPHQVLEVKGSKTVFAQYSFKHLHHGGFTEENIRNIIKLDIELAIRVGVDGFVAVRDSFTILLFQIAEDFYPQFLVVLHVSPADVDIFYIYQMAGRHVYPHVDGRRLVLMDFAPRPLNHPLDSKDWYILGSVNNPFGEAYMNYKVDGWFRAEACSRRTISEWGPWYTSEEQILEKSQNSIYMRSVSPGFADETGHDTDTETTWFDTWQTVHEQPTDMVLIRSWNDLYDSSYVAPVHPMVSSRTDLPFVYQNQTHEAYFHELSWLIRKYKGLAEGPSYQSVSLIHRDVPIAEYSYTSSLKTVSEFGSAKDGFAVISYLKQRTYATFYYYGADNGPSMQQHFAIDPGFQQNVIPFPDKAYHGTVELHLANGCQIFSKLTPFCHWVRDKDPGYPLMNYNTNARVCWSAW